MIEAGSQRKTRNKRLKKAEWQRSESDRARLLTLDY